jgi:hypothetical protein
MPRTITFRVKSPVGEWQRAVIDETDLPESITGLTPGETYEVDTGRGTLVDITTLSDFTVETQDGDVSINYGAGGAVSITITGGDYAGTYTEDSDGTPLTTTLIEAAPVNLIKPVLAGDTATGDELTLTPGIWIYAGADPGDPTFQWRRASTNIANEVGLTYVLTTADAGQNITVRETLGASFVDSNVVAADAITMASDAEAIAWYDDTTVTVNGSDEITLWANKVSGGSAWNLSLDVTGTRPIWNAANKRAIFTGAETLRGTANLPNIFANVENGTKSLTVIMAVEYNTSLAGSGIFGATESTNANQSWFMGARGNEANRLVVSNQRFAQGYGSFSENGFIANTGTFTHGKIILEKTVTQTTFEVRVNGVLVHSASVTTGNLMNATNSRAQMGALRASDAASTSRFTGFVHEVFVTNSSAVASFFRAEMAAKHGITL